MLQGLFGLGLIGGALGLLNRDDKHVLQSALRVATEYADQLSIQIERDPGVDERDRKDLTTREKRLMREAMRGFMKAEKALENLT
jgi:hypothetical protein